MKSSPIDVSYVQAILGYISALALLAGILWFRFRESITKRQEKDQLKKKLVKFLFDKQTIKKSTHNYITPNCTCNIETGKQAEPEINETESDKTQVESNQNIFNTVCKLLSAKNTPYKYFILLGDAGMGKTSFVLNYFFYNHSLPKDKRQNISLVPLGIPNAIKRIKQVPNQPYTVLFLDGFDEYERAAQDSMNRLNELMQACKYFKAVLITSSEQCLKTENKISDKANPDKTINNFINVGYDETDKSVQYKLYKLYLSPFTNEQIKEFLNKRFQVWQFIAKKRTSDISNKLKELGNRPMYLSYLADITEGYGRKKVPETSNMYQIYQQLINRWMKKESKWITQYELLPFAKKLAVDIYSNIEERKQPVIPQAELVDMGKYSHIYIDDTSFAHKDSLLHRDIEGNGKFAHRSIMEFLFVEFFLEIEDSQRSFFSLTELMRQFVVEKIKLITNVQILPFSLCLADLENANLCGANLKRNNLKGVNLKGANLEGANLEGVEFFKQTLSLEGANFQKATGLSLEQRMFAREHGAIIEFIPGEMTIIPKGTFLYGEKMQQKEIDYDYHMDVFPVTNQMYKKFIDAGGYEKKELWSLDGWSWRNNNITEPRYWNDTKFNNPKQPVVGISWYEAQAYCNWRSQESGQNYRLPTEEEWEKAARGNDGREYPWGNTFDKNKCNCSESKVLATTDVTGHPGSASPYGCQDMAGNIWEWTHSCMIKDIRVLRGGSWLYNQTFAQCYSRSYNELNFRNSNVGFRCLRESSADSDDSEEEQNTNIQIQLTE